MERTLWLIESPLAVIAGEELTCRVEWLAAGRVEDPAAWVFLDGVDITAEVMPGEDEHRVRGRVMTLKRLAPRPEDGGQQYLLLVQALVDGDLQRRKCLVEVARAERAE